jgi:hypothetical protein
MKKKRIIYKNTLSNDLVLKKDGEYFLLDENDCFTNQSIPNKIIENSSEWKLIIPEGRLGFNLNFKEDGEIYFINELTDEEYHIGDYFTIPNNISFSDGSRYFNVKSFYISSTTVTHNRFEFVYVKTKEGKDIILSDVILMNKTEKEKI